MVPTCFFYKSHSIFPIVELSKKLTPPYCPFHAKLNKKAFTVDVPMNDEMIMLIVYGNIIIEE